MKRRDFLKTPLALLGAYLGMKVPREISGPGPVTTETLTMKDAFEAMETGLKYSRPHKMLYYRGPHPLPRDLFENDAHWGRSIPDIFFKRQLAENERISQRVDALLEQRK